MLSKKEAVVPEYFQGYLSKAEDTSLPKAIRHNTKAFVKFLNNLPSKKRNYSYAEGKWTIKEVLQHIIDTEKVFVYRALTFSRHDMTPLSGFDQEQWATHANKSERKWSDMVKEFETARAAVQFFFESLSDEDLLFEGKVRDYPANALGFGYVLTGHATHHLNILQEKYLNKVAK